MSVSNPHSIENFVTNGWRGYFPLSQAFWRYYIIGRIVAGLVAAPFLYFFGFFGWFMAILIWVPYWIWSFATLWKSAFNSGYPFLGYVVRIGLYFEVILIIFNPMLLTIVS